MLLVTVLRLSGDSGRAVVSTVSWCWRCLFSRLFSGLRGWRLVSGVLAAFPGMLAAGLPVDRSRLPGCGLFCVGQAAAGAAAAVVAVRAWRASCLVRAVMALRMLWLAAQRASSASMRLPR